MLGVTIFCFSLLLSSAHAFYYSEEGRLVNHLLANYDRMGQKYARPVNQPSDSLEVKHGVSLQHIFDVNPSSGIVEMTIWENFEWKDLALEWKASDFGGVQSIRVPLQKIFTPDVILYNQERDIERVNTLAVIYSDGTVSWVPPAKVHALCLSGDEDADEQECMLNYGSWTYDGTKIDLQAMRGAVDVSTYLPNNDWDLTGTEAKRHSATYECCPEPYVTVKYKLKLKRRED